MLHRFRTRYTSMVAASATLALLFAVGAPGLAGIAAAEQSGQLQSEFANAAAEFGVPEDILLSIGYNQSRWENHGASPSADGGFGVMNLTTVTQPEDGRGDPHRPVVPRNSNRTHYTLDEASQVLGIPANTLKTDTRQNIRGAAAVLAKYSRELNNGNAPAALDEWYGAVAAFSGSPTTDGAQTLADDVYSTLQSGETRTTTDRQTLRLNARPQITPKRDAVERLQLRKAQQSTSGAECPATLNCRFVPAGYALNSSDPTDYGNYDAANRPKDMKIDYIVIHDTEGSYQSAINHFQDTSSYVSCQYIVRSSDGAITQMVHNQDVAWCAGDWYVNMHSINIEHEGFATQGATWYTEAMYKSSATLVRYLGNKYGIPMDREHIIGHDEVPSVRPNLLAGQHWDPGAYWDWNHYMALIHGTNDQAELQRAGATGSLKAGQVVTISPTFSTNQQPLTDCSTDPCTTLPPQGTNFVYVRSQPQADAPLLGDTYLHSDNSPGTTAINDWGDKAVTGAKYVVAQTQGDWTALYFSDKVGWVYNPAQNPVLRKTNAKTVTAADSSLLVYGAAYPEAAAYPSDIPVQNLQPLYTAPAGQRYVIADQTIPTDYYYAMTIDQSIPHDHTVVVGSEKYTHIFFNHRHMFIRQADSTTK